MLFSDGKETVPSNPDNPKGAFTAARTAKDQGVPISTISFGTPSGVITYEGQEVPVPTDDLSLQKIAKATGGESFRAETLDQLTRVYSNLQEQIGYQTIRGDASGSWTRQSSWRRVQPMARAASTTVGSTARMPCSV